jgi:hypothetical protein
VQQLRDFGLKGMGLFAHINSKSKNQKTKTPHSLGRCG